jgi:hypothetical protein
MAAKGNGTDQETRGVSSVFRQGALQNRPDISGRFFHFNMPDSVVFLPYE